VVVEGCGSNGCEYMTGGTAVILGRVGDNFGAGMSGGMAFVYDEAGDFPLFVNDGSVVHQRLESQYWESHLRSLIEQHAEETQSRFARRLLNDWMLERGKFWQIAPKEMLDKLTHPLSDVRAANLAE
jgi:glutamate synthase (NADPH/NADH) large chain